MFKTVTLVVVVLAIVFASLAAARKPKWDQLTPEYSYEQYLADLGKPAPSPDTYALRKSLFERNLRTVLAHNAAGRSWQMGVNEFSDWSDLEFKRMLGYKKYPDSVVRELHAKPYVRAHQLRAPKAERPIPPALDYRNALPAILTTVKDQGMCGSCWAHASTEVMESHYAMATGQLYVLSQGAVTQCAPNPNQCGGTGGCEGSIAELAYDWVMQAGGLEQVWSYPYTSYSGTTGTCQKHGAGPRVAKFSGYTTVRSNDQTHFVDALVYAGPLAVNVQASNWQNYEAGVFSGCDYAQNISIDHVVVAVGYGREFRNDKFVDYFLIRNSWNAGWGDDGYIKLLKTSPAQCGWNVQAQNGVACRGQPSVEWVCGECGVLYSVTYPNALVPPSN